MKPVEMRPSQRNGAWESSMIGKPTRCQVRFWRNATHIYRLFLVAQNHQESHPGPRVISAAGSRLTECTPGSILLMSNTKRNEPLGLRNAPARTSASSLPSPFPPGSIPGSARPSLRRQLSGHSVEEKKRTKDGKFILEPQPEDSMNDPLNWPSWRRDVALLSLGFYCMLGGGMTPVLAAGFVEVAATYKISIAQVALTTGLYMMGLGVGSVVFSPTAILFGKRPVYLVGIMLFIVSAVWCAVSPNYASLVVARVFMGLAVRYVFSESIFLFLIQIWSRETCSGGFHSWTMFQDSRYPSDRQY